MQTHRNCCNSFYSLQGARFQTKTLNCWSKNKLQLFAFEGVHFLTFLLFVEKRRGEDAEVDGASWSEENDVVLHGEHEIDHQTRRRIHQLAARLQQKLTLRLLKLVYVLCKGRSVSSTVLFTTDLSCDQFHSRKYSKQFTHEGRWKSFATRYWKTFQNPVHQ